MALLSTFSKVIEKVVSAKIYSFVEKYNIISSSQHGFRPGYSTETETVECVQHVYEMMDRGRYVVAILFDLTRAFDSVDPVLLSEKIDSLGIRGSLNQWINSFLINRKIVVRVEEVISREFDVDLGTPQGSVLGPLIFMLYINDLPDNISVGKTFLYADDTCIVVSDTSLSELNSKIEIIFHEFNNWCNTNKLIVNHSKSVVIEFFNNHRKPSITRVNFNNQMIDISENCKLLGTILDCNLAWADEIENICHKMQKACFMIHTLKNILTTKSLINVYYAYVYSILSYNVMVWGRAKDVGRVFILQKRIIRSIFDLPYRTSCRGVFVECEIFTLTSIYLYKLLVYIFNNKRKFKTHADRHDYHTRNKNDLLYGKNPQHSFYLKSPIVTGIKYMNGLPREILSSGSARVFKNRLRIFLARGGFYSLAEFEECLRSETTSG